MIIGGVILAAFTAITLGYPTDEHTKLNIVGGHIVPISKRPYMVAVLRSGNFTCGGILIAKDTVLTGAHCVTSVFEEFTVYVGSNSYLKGGDEIGVSTIKYHENWDPFLNDNDLALISLNSSVTNPHASVIELASENVALSEGETVNITGWGALDQDVNEWSDLLRTAKVNVLPTDNCSQAYNVRFNASSMFCAGFFSTSLNSGPCDADSGGPVVKDGLLVGVISFNLGCGRDEFPGAYLSIPVYRDWIRKIANV